ncbi:MAG: adenylate/guanylate cyclase domain-containing protein, partial [Chloroflexota bacterium]|nr:adenylate/guanylate cyclase domain-containing protein [Chloroflexota bacterium]
MADLPAGTVTFLFGDIAAGASLRARFPRLLPSAIARYQAILQQTLPACGGTIFHIDEGHCRAAFTTAREALAAALAARRALQTEDWGEPGVLPVRLGLHTATAGQRDGTYVG